MARRITLAFTASAVLVLLFVAGSAPVGATPGVTSVCDDVLSATAPAGELVQSVAVGDHHRNAIVHVTLTTRSPIDRGFVIDCSWVDRNANSVRDPGERTFVRLWAARFVGGLTRSASIRVELPGAAGARVCGRVGVLALDARDDIVHLTSNVACGTTRPPVVPEASSVAVLGATGLLTVVVAFVVIRRRRTVLESDLLSR